MKEIYIILTHTGTTLSKIIKSYTKDEFSHVSISLDVKLENMYSFGRLKPYNPFIGGFVHEYINKGTYKRFYNTKAKMYSLEVDELQYDKLKRIINDIEIENEKERYKFNILGLLAVGFNKKISIKRSFYCAEFVKYVMEKSGININLPDIIKPEDFKKIDGLKLIYDGLLRKYKYKNEGIKDKIREKLLLYKQKEGIVWVEKIR